MASVPDTAVGPPPPELPERRGEKFPRWPLWGPFAAVGIGAAAGILTVGMLSSLLQSTGPKLDPDSPWFTSLSSFGLDVCVVGATVLVATLTAKPHLWHFG